MRPCAILLVILAAMTTACQKKFADLEEEFVYTTLAFSPTAATSAGLHQYGGKNLDQLLDDVSVAGFDRQRRFYRSFQSRLAKLQREDLPLQDQVDYDIISGPDRG